MRVPIEGDSQVNSRNAVESQSAPCPRKEHKRHRGKNRKLHLSDVYDWDNLRKAYKDARKGKGDKNKVKKFNRHWWKNMVDLQKSLVDETFVTSQPKFVTKKCDKKERVLSMFTFVDNVEAHALMNVISPAMNRSYYYESAASIVGRGIHYLVKHVRRWIDRNNHKPIYFAQLDFKKCYHNIKRDLVYEKFVKNYNDKGIQRLCYDFIHSLRNHNGLEPSDGTRGMGIGHFPVQPSVNYLYNDLDRKAASVPNTFYGRYCDNMAILGHSAEDVWKVIKIIQYEAEHTYDQPLHTNIGVQLMDNERHGLDFIGYVFYTNKTFIRKDIKQAFKKKFNKTTDPEVFDAMLASYKGWLMHADALHLWQKVTGMLKFSDLKIKQSDTTRDGQRYFNVPNVSASFLVGRTIIVKDFIEGVQTSHGGDRFVVLVEENKINRKFITNNAFLKDVLIQAKTNDQLPFEAILRSRSLDGGKIDYYFE